MTGGDPVSGGLTPDALREIRERATGLLSYLPASPSVVVDVMAEDVPALCDEVTRLRAALGARAGLSDPRLTVQRRVAGGARQEPWSGWPRPGEHLLFVQQAPCRAAPDRH